MCLIEYYNDKCKNMPFEQAVKSVYDEIEKRYGIISDDEKIKPAFFYKEEGCLMANDEFKEFLPFLYKVEEDIKNHPDQNMKEQRDCRHMLSFVEEMRGWHAYTVYDQDKKNTDPKVLQRVKDLCDYITKIEYRDAILIYHVKNGERVLTKEMDMRHYLDGQSTFKDIQVHNLLVENMLSENPAYVDVRTKFNLRYQFCLANGDWALDKQSELELLNYF